MLSAVQTAVRCSNSWPTGVGRPRTPDARFPRLTFLNKSHYLEDSDLWLMDGSYLRLKVAEIGYTFRDIPAFRKVGVKSLKVYFSGYNLLTLFSDLNDIDIDPEGATERFEYRFLPERAHFQLRCKHHILIDTPL